MEQGVYAFSHWDLVLDISLLDLLNIIIGCVLMQLSQIKILGKRRRSLLIPRSIKR